MIAYGNIYLDYKYHVASLQGYRLVMYSQLTELFKMSYYVSIENPTGENGFKFIVVKMTKDKEETLDTGTLNVSKKGEKEETTKDKVKTFSQEELNEIVGTTRKEVREQLTKEFKTQLEHERKEAERLAKLSADEKEKELLTLQKEENEARDKELAIRENKLEVFDIFARAKVDSQLIDFVISEDKEESIERANRFIESYQKSVEESVADKLKGKAPYDAKSDNKTTSEVVTNF